MNYRDIDSLYNDDTYTTTTQGGNWTWTTTVKPSTTSTVTTTVTPSTAGQVYWGSSGSVGIGTTAPFSSIHKTPWSNVLDTEDVRIQGLGSVKELLQNLTFLTPPPGLDTDNPTVLDALKVWYQAVQELRQRHEQLQMLIKLTDETR